MTLKRFVLRETTPSCMASSQFEYNAKQVTTGVLFSSVIRIPPGPYTQYINELYPNRILRVNFSEIQFAFETAEREMVRLSYC